MGFTSVSEKHEGGLQNQEVKLQIGIPSLDEDTEKAKPAELEPPPNYHFVESPSFINLQKLTGDNKVSAKVVPEGRPPCWRRFLGIGLGILSSISFALSLTLVSMMHKKGYHVFSMGFWRFQAMVYPSLIWLFVESVVMKDKPCGTLCPLSEKPKLKMFGWLLTRSILGSIASLCLFASASFIGPPEASAITFSSPILVTILARLLLGESYGFVPFFSAVLNIVGLIVISRPPWLFGGDFDMSVVIGVVFGIVSLTGNTGVVLSLRVLRKTSFAVIGLSFGIIGVISSLGGMIYADRLDEWTVREMEHLPFAIGIGLTTFLGQVFFTLSMRFEEAGVISLVRCLDIVLSFLWQMVLLNRFPDLISIGGTTIVMLAVALIGFRKIVTELPEDNPNRRRFRFLLA